MAGYLGASPVPQTIQKKQSFTATASQTTFTTTGYTDGNFINVFLNGVRLVNGTDYTATNGSDIVLTTGASAGDVLDFETFNEFTLVDQTLETPTFRTSATLKNDTHEDTDGGRESTLIFKGEQSGGEISTLAEIEASHDGTADDEKGDLIFRTNDGSDGASPTERMRIDSGGTMTVTSTDQSIATFSHSSSSTAALNGGGIVSIKNTDSTNGNQSSIIFRDSANNSTSGIFGFNTDHSDGEGFMKFGTRDSSGTFAERMRIDSSGNVGIGKTPNSWRTSDVALQLADATSEYANFVSGGTGITFGAGWYRDGASNNFKYTHSSTTAGRYDYNYTATNAFTWHQAAAGTAGNDITFSEAMRLDSSGRLHIGSTVHSGSTVRFSVKADGGGSEYGVGIDLGGLSVGTRWLEFRNVTSTFGNIDWSGSVVRYNTNSDYRLKTNITDLSNGITKVKQLQPREFNWIHNPDQTVDGFIAHEVSTVVPEAVSGTYNEVEVWRDGEELPDGVSVGDNKLDDDGNTIPKYQGIDQAKLVPVLTAALQEAIAKIEILETKVAALEAE